jgi:putative salt-induced outer membrane protein YdiY
MRLKQLLSFCATIPFLTVTLTADVLQLKNGDRVSGKIVTSDDKEITIKTDFAGEIKVKREMVTSVATDEPLIVTLPDGSKVQGKVSTAGEQVTVAPAAAAPATAKLSEVKSIRDEPSQKAWERAQERITHPGWGDFWAGSLGFNFAGASGNAQTQAFGTGFDASRETGRDKTALYFKQIYATQSTTEPTGATANRMSGGARYDYNIGPKFFVFGTADFDYDKFLDLDLRSVLGGGLGYHIIKNPRHTWDFNLGFVWNREKFDTSNQTIPPIPGASLVRNSAELLLGENSEHKLGRLTLFQRLSVFPNLSDPGEFRLAFDTGATMPLFKFLEWQLAINDRYLSNPPLGKKKNDLLYTTGIRVSFAQK